MNDDIEEPPNLFSQQGDSLARAYMNLQSAKGGHAEELRLHCEELWHRFYPFADRNFVEMFAVDIDERYWEMYLGCTLLELGLDLQKKRSIAGPDLFVIHNGQKIWIEATAPSQGQDNHADRVPDITAGVVQDVPRDKLLLRLTHALWEKKQKFDKYVTDGLIDEQDIQVIAVSGSRFSRWAAGGLPLIVSAVYPFGAMRVSFPISGDGEVTTDFEYQPHVEKSSGEEIPTTAFLDPLFSNISAVIFDPRGLGAVRGRLGCEFVTVHNQMANAALPPSLIQRGREYVPNGEELSVTDWEHS